MKKTFATKKDIKKAMVKDKKDDKKMIAKMMKSGKKCHVCGK